MNYMAFHGLGYAQYEWHTFGHPLDLRLCFR